MELSTHSVNVCSNTLDDKKLMIIKSKHINMYQANILSLTKPFFDILLPFNINTLSEHIYIKTGAPVL